jgi:hypothetical protein
MQRSVKPLALRLTVLIAGCLAAGFLVAGCSSVTSSVKSAVSSIASRSPTAATATTAGTPSVTPTTATPSATAASTPAASTPAASTPAATAAPSAAAAAPTTAAPSATASPAAGSATSLLWLWILLGAAVVAILITLVTRSVRRGSAATAADSRSGLVDAYAKASALHDAMSVAEAPGAVAADDAGYRWADIQRRADDLAQSLYALRESLPDPADKMRVADTLTSLQAVRSAMDAERAPGGAGPRQAEVVRDRLSAFESSLRALRPNNQRYP